MEGSQHGSCAPEIATAIEILSLRVSCNRIEGSSGVEVPHSSFAAFIPSAIDDSFEGLAFIVTCHGAVACLVKVGKANMGALLYFKQYLNLYNFFKQIQYIKC